MRLKLCSLLGRCATPRRGSTRRPTENHLRDRRSQDLSWRTYVHAGNELVRLRVNPRHRATRVVRDPHRPKRDRHALRKLANADKRSDVVRRGVDPQQLFRICACGPQRSLSHSEAAAGTNVNCRRQLVLLGVDAEDAASVDITQPKRASARDRSEQLLCRQRDLSSDHALGSISGIRGTVGDFMLFGGSAAGACNDKRDCEKPHECGV